MGSEGSGLRVTREGSVATVVLDRPERRNAISLAMWEALAEVFPALGADDDVDVVVVRGTPGGPFSAGADISEFEDKRLRPDDADRYGAAVEAGERAVIECAKPTVALVQGFAIGGGTQLAVACDLRVCDEGARFGVTPAKLGIVYALPSTARLVDVAGSAWASWLLLTGELVDARTALRVGLVHEVTVDVEARAYALADVLASRARVSLTGAKQLLARVARGDRTEDDAVRALYRSSSSGPEYAEGVRAFLDKRSPDFRAARHQGGSGSPSSSAPPGRQSPDR